ncbi:polyprenol reductase [Diorhabda sublineata]|uniref:polyprenol reductase n=1 Tax=Diorhabda sublineata TaxID=1163346 RepID=UPI0024E05509|nr:polyprenol reductase [Diorhabda sublineata]
MNYIIFIFSVATTMLIILATLLNFFEAKLPVALGQFFRYGKFASKEKCALFSKLNVEVPKSWFKHFYIVALICYTTMFIGINAVYIFKFEVPHCVIHWMNAISGNSLSFVTTTQTYIAVCLMTLQVSRRFYETHYVSIFGKNSYINVNQYILGIVYYPGTCLAILCEAPKFVKSPPYFSQEINFINVTYMEILAICIFLWGWWHQYRASEILANLRKNKKGEIVTSEHKLPFGDWFEYISSPLQAAEIIMYTALTVILKYHFTWFFVYAWVVVNQVETMLLNHWWYQDTFPDYPKNRKALIPLIY